MNDRERWIETQRRQQHGSRVLIFVIIAGALLVYAGVALASSLPAVIHTIAGWL